MLKFNRHAIVGTLYSRYLLIFRMLQKKTNLVLEFLTDLVFLAVVTDRWKVDC